MAEKVNWSFAAQAAGGPAVSGSGEVADIDAYVKLNVTVAANSSQDVEVQTGTGGPLHLLVISPEKPDSKLTYKVGNNQVPLDGPLVLIGSGAASLLGANVGKMTFKNGSTTDDAAISILAARDATP